MCSLFHTKYLFSHVKKVKILNDKVLVKETHWAIEKAEEEFLFESGKQNNLGKKRYEKRATGC